MSNILLWSMFSDFSEALTKPLDCVVVMWTLPGDLVSDHSVSLGFWFSGVQRQPVRCIEKGSGVVEETLCNPETRPEGRQKKCKNQDCPARWGEIRNKYSKTSEISCVLLLSSFLVIYNCCCICYIYRQCCYGNRMQYCKNISL